MCIQKEKVAMIIAKTSSITAMFALITNSTKRRLIDILEELKESMALLNIHSHPSPVHEMQDICHLLLIVFFFIIVFLLIQAFQIYTTLFSLMKTGLIGVFT